MSTRASGFETNPELNRESLRAVAASLIGQLTSGTMVIGLFAVLMPTEIRDLGWSQTTMGAMAGAFMVSSALALPVLGHLADRVGPRLVVLCGTLAAGAAFLILALQTALIIQGIAAFMIAGVASAVSVAHVRAHSQRFDRHRGTVLALLGVVVGVSFGLTPLVGDILLQSFGWRATYALFALLPLGISFPVLFFWFHNPVPANRAVDRPAKSGTPWKNGRLWLIVATAAGSAFVFAGFQAHIVAFLQERGFSQSRAVSLISIAVFGGIACQLLTGRLLDRFRRPGAALPFALVALCGAGLLALGGGMVTDSAGILLLQSGIGGELSVIPYLVSRFFAPSALGRTFGTVMLLAQIVGSPSPVLMGVVHDRSGSYMAVMPVFLICLAGSLVALLLLDRAYRRIRAA